MGHEFAQHKEAEVPASPDEIWAAIATGPGIDSWFMGRNEVQAGAGGAVRTVFGEYTPELPITGWDPGHRFAYGSDRAPDGRFIAYEFLIEGRAGSELYFRTLVAYLTHFAGRFAVPVTAFGPPGTSWSRDRPLLCHALGLSEEPKPGDQARVTNASASETGTVYFANANSIGVRTPDGLFRFMRGFAKPVIAAHHLFGADAEPDQARQTWEAWLSRTLA